MPLLLLVVFSPYLFIFLQYIFLQEIIKISFKDI